MDSENKRELEKQLLSDKWINNYKNGKRDSNYTELINNKIRLKILIEKQISYLSFIDIKKALTTLIGKLCFQ